MNYPPEIVEEFWKRVQKTDTCWYWLGSKDANGYGRLRLGAGGRRFNRQAYWVSWEIANQDTFPKGKLARHSCDNPPCVNPAHIVPGTHYDNHHDMISRGRKIVSTSIGRVHSRLRERDVRRIQELLLDEKLTDAAIAREYGVEVHTISNIKSGRTWAHLTTETLEQMRKRNNVTPRGDERGHAKLTVPDVLQIRELAQQGMVQREIAGRFGVVPQTVSRIVNRQKWSHVL